ncbi:sensor histidine kinase [Novipirellula herctigrandis]|uniref:sensor histidine kinase n=1 Tax=Novipirellula herctigrandis TaxID=2527986 RepID=UPI003AF389E5
MRHYRTRIALALGVVLMPAGTALDFAIYPNDVWQLSIIRFATSVMLFLGLLLVLKLSCEGCVEAISVLFLVIPSLAIALMIRQTNGVQSPYYLGLILLMIVVHLLGFRTTEAILYCVVTIGAYFAAIISHPDPTTFELSHFVQGTFFLVTSAIVCVFVSNVNFRNRLTAFNLQTALKEEQTRLEKSLRQLQETEAQLFQSEKTRAIAGLAAGLLHEINNPVNFSLMALKVMKKRTASDSPNVETLNDIEEGVQRIGQIVSDLRSFAHPEHEHTKSPFRISDAVVMAERFSRSSLTSSELQILDSEAMRSFVVGSESQIVQVLLNLILNANSANERVRDRQASVINVSAELKEDRLAVTVEDHGIGMTEEQVQHAVEPFYSDSGGQGLGLGLSICGTIVAAHDGQLLIQSEPNVGTRVVFDLPVHPCDSAPPDNRVGQSPAFLN